MSKRAVQRKNDLFWALLLSNALGVGFLGLRALEAGNSRYGFLIWNAMLAWLPLGFALWLMRRLKRSRWLTPGNVLLTLAWLGFLPNSFYLITDLIHLRVTGEVSVLYDAVMFCLFIFNAYLVGFMSLYLVHRELERRHRPKVPAVVGLVLLACSFAIYLGRTLRWNTWDVLVNPAGLLFDVSDRVINPGLYPQTMVTTMSFFLLLGSVYLVVWRLAGVLRPEK